MLLHSIGDVPQGSLWQLHGKILVTDEKLVFVPSPDKKEGSDGIAVIATA